MSKKQQSVDEISVYTVSKEVFLHAIMKEPFCDALNGHAETNGEIVPYKVSACLDTSFIQRCSQK